MLQHYLSLSIQYFLQCVMIGIFMDITWNYSESESAAVYSIQKDSRCYHTVCLWFHPYCLANTWWSEFSWAIDTPDESDSAFYSVQKKSDSQSYLTLPFPSDILQMELFDDRHRQAKLVSLYWEREWQKQLYKIKKNGLLNLTAAYTWN